MLEMLKITKVETPTEQRLVLEGHLTWPWLKDLGSHWEKTREEHPEREFVVELTGVTRIDSRGERALREMKNKGARFVSRGNDITSRIFS